MSNPENVGKVYLVGAGPGDPGLITWRGIEVLGLADVVCIDQLVDPTIIATLPSDVERYFVGKYAGNHTLPQNEIEDIMIKLAKDGKNVVRLKGGDPFVFGRGGEEAIALKNAGIPFEVVPGVTSAVAAAAYAGIPITQRELSTFAMLLTAHESPDKEESAATVPYEQLAKLEGGTFAGYMGVKTLPRIAGGLIKNGMDKDIPAALIERGTTGAQKTVISTLENLAEDGKKAGIKPPAMFVIGDVVGLSEKIDWFDPGPLAGKRVMVMRPADQATHYYDRLRKLGASVIPAPSIWTKENFHSIEWAKVLEIGNETSGWIVFTSENGVRYFFNHLFKMGCDIRWMGSWKIAAIGLNTEKALKKFALRADFIPSKSTSLVLAEEFPELLKEEDFVIRVRGNLGDQKIEKAINESGSKAISLEVYETVTSKLDETVRAWVAQAPIDILTFTSGSTFISFIEQWGDEGREMLKSVPIASIGPATSAIIREAGYEIAVQAEVYNIDGLAEALVKYFN